MSTFMGISDVRDRLPELVDKISEGADRITITVHGKPKVTLISQEELESIQETAEILATYPTIKKDLEKSKKQIREGKFVRLEDLI